MNSVEATALVKSISDKFQKLQSDHAAALAKKDADHAAELAARDSQADMAQQSIKALQDDNAKLNAQVTQLQADHAAATDLVPDAAATQLQALAGLVLAAS
jgi:hypothetical protein